MTRPEIDLYYCEICERGFTEDQLGGRDGLQKIDGMMKKLDGYIKAMEAATALATSPGIVAAADKLLKEAEKPIGGEEDGKPKPAGPADQGGA